MPLQFLSKKNLIPAFMLLPCAFALINSAFFESASLAAYFYYVIAASVLAIATGTVYLKHRQNVRIAYPLPLFLLAALTLYYLLQDLFLKRQLFNIMHFSLLANCLLLISYCILFSAYKINIRSLFIGITVLACIESLFCLFQFLHWIQGPSKLFLVSGTWVNPNVSAMFLTLTVPAIGALLFRPDGTIARFCFIPLLLVICAIATLKCRTAYIGLVAITLLVLNARYSLLRKIRNKYTGFRILLLLGLIFLATVAAALYLYNVKKASADGRMLVWKISMNMFSGRPVTGYGYGRFDHDYNLAQADYFSKQHATGTETRNASYVYMAYNEFLQNAVEGGSIGVSIFFALACSLLLVPLRKSGFDTPARIVYPAIVAFFIMSIFNFTVQAIPAMALFVVYTGLISTHVQRQGLLPELILPGFAKVPIGILLVTLGLYIGYTNVRLAINSVEGREAASLVTPSTIQAAISKFETIREPYQSDFYLANYSTALFVRKDYKLALQTLQAAISMKSYPFLYLQMGACYQRLGKLDSALAAYTMAKNIIPNRIAPWFALMNVYKATGDTAHAVMTAIHISHMQVTAKSKETDFYIMEARRILTQLTAAQHSFSHP